MNHGISILFRAIPLAMAAFCFGYGAYVFAAGSDPSRLIAGPVVFFLGSICVALYCTAATIIRQIIGTYSAAAKYLFPAVGYAFAAMTVICGIFIITSNMTGAYVTGHVVCGLGLITACVSTAATSSTRFSLIPTIMEKRPNGRKSAKRKPIPSVIWNNNFPWQWQERIMNARPSSAIKSSNCARRPINVHAL